MNERLKKIVMHPVREYRKVLNPKEKICDLTVGEGHYDCPFNAKLGAYEALLSNKTKYSSVIGEEALRKKYTSKFYPMYHYDECIVTNGSTQGIFSVLMMLITGLNDEVIIPTPYYPAYLNSVNLLGGTPRVTSTKQKDFKITPELLQAYINERTKAVIINEPNNPSGITYTKAEKEELLKFFWKHDFYIIIDEVYKVYTDDTFISFAELLDNDLKSRFIFINSLSKSYLMTGFRIGFVLASQTVIQELQKINYLMVSSISSIMQDAALRAIDDSSYLEFIKKYYIKNRIILQEELTNLGIDYVKADGGYYVFLGTKKLGLTGLELAKVLGKKHNIAVVPGEIFGAEFCDYIRVSCCRDIKDILYFVKTLTDYLDAI